MNSIRPFRDIKRRPSKEINVGKVKIGGQNPISVQSMTNTLTTDVKKTIEQVNSLYEAGADIVRISCPDEDSTKSLKEIIKNVFSRFILPLMCMFSKTEYRKPQSSFIGQVPPKKIIGD